VIVIARANNIIDQWIMSPLQNAAGNLGLFRIMYSVFFIFSLADSYFAEASSVTAAEWDPLQLINILFPMVPNRHVLSAIELGLVFSLVLLGFGFKMRLMTFNVFVFGTVLLGVRLSFLMSHSFHFLMSWIPLVMIFSRWGDIYSIDSILGKKNVSPHDTSWHFNWPVKFILCVLCFMFFSAALIKVRYGWLSEFNKIQTALFARNTDRITVVPYLWIAQNIYLYASLQIMALMFEGFYPLALINRTLLRIYLIITYFFHAFNLIFLGIPFTGIFIVYALFVDWQTLRDRFPDWRLNISSRLLLKGVPVLVAVGLMLVWNSPYSPRNILATTYPLLVYGIGAAVVTVGMIDVSRDIFAWSRAALSGSAQV